MNASASASAGTGGGSAQTALQQRKATLRAFRKNTRKRYQPWNFNLSNLAPSSTASAVAPQVGLASRCFVQFRFTVSDPAATPAVTKLPRGPFNYIQRIQFVTNLGSNNIWDTDGWNCYINNLSKSIVRGRADAPIDNGFDQTYASTTSDYPNNPYFQYPSVVTQNVVYNVCFTLEIDLCANPQMNFTQGLLNLQAPQVQASINVVTGTVQNMYNTSDALSITGSANIYYEYYEIPNPMRKVALPGGMLHCTLQQNLAFASTGIVQYQIPRQGILLRLQQECVANAVLMSGGPVGSAGNAGTAGIDLFALQLNNQDTVYQKNWELFNHLMLEEWSALSKFKGMFIHEFFDAMFVPSSGDLRDAIDTEAVTTTTFNTTVDAATTLGSNTNYFNFTREILLPFNTAAAGS